MHRDDSVEALQQVVVVVRSWTAEQCEPGDRECGHGRLADAAPECDGLLGAAAHRDVVSGQEVAEAEPLQAVDDRCHGAGLAGSRQGVRVEALLCVVVTQLQRGVGEVPQHVAVVDLVADGQGPVQGLAAADQSPSATWVMATSMCRRQSVRAESSAAAVPGARRTATGFRCRRRTCASRPRRRPDLQGPGRVEQVHAWAASTKR